MDNAERMLSHTVSMNNIGLNALFKTINAMPDIDMYLADFKIIEPYLLKFNSNNIEEMESIIKISDRNKDALMPRDQYIRDIMSVMSSVTNSAFLDVTKALQDGITASIISNVLAVSNVAYELVRSLEWVQLLMQDDRRQAETLEAFASIGWPIAPSMPDDLLERVADLWRQGKGRYAVQPILGYYRRREYIHLIDAVRSWSSSPLHAERMDIFWDCLEDHCRGRYTLLIPALLLQIEGILRVYAYQTQSAHVNARIAPICAAALNDEDVLCWSDWSTAQALLHVLRENIYKGHTPFDAELRKLAHRRTATRNTIAHGVSFRYDRVAISLRLFLVLDALTILAGYLMKDAA